MSASQAFALIGWIILAPRLPERWAIGLAVAFWVGSVVFKVGGA